MFKQLTYQKKVYVLLGSGLLFFIIAYHLSISPTLKLREECNTMDGQLLLIEKSEEKIQGLQNRVSELDRLIGTNISKGIDFQDLLMEQVSLYCKENNLIFRDLKQTHKSQKGNYQIETNHFSVEGTFIPLLKLVYNLETDYNTGQILSFCFESKKDRKTKRRRLFVNIYYQNIKQINH